MTDATDGTGRPGTDPRGGPDRPEAATKGTGLPETRRTDTGPPPDRDGYTNTDTNANPEPEANWNTESTADEDGPPDTRPAPDIRAAPATGASAAGSRRTDGSPETAASEVLSALADPTRRRILDALAARGRATATVLATEVPVSRQAIVKHLAVLTRAGLVEGTREGREARYTVLPERLGTTAHWMLRVASDWDARLASIKRLAEAAPEGPRPAPAHDGPAPDAHRAPDADQAPDADRAGNQHGTRDADTEADTAANQTPTPDPDNDPTPDKAQAPAPTPRE